MKKICLTLVITLSSLTLFSQTEYSEWFTGECLRIDYILAGSDQESEIYLQTLKKEPLWAGSRKNLIDTLGYGEYFCKLYPVGSRKEIYSSGFSTLFQEWQTTEEAKILKKGFYQTNLVPFPRFPVILEILERNRDGKFEQKLSLEINPEDYFIQPSPPKSYPVEKILVSGSPENCIDIVFLPEGYTSTQMNKFISDVKRFTDSLFVVKPFDKYRNKFNIYAVLSPSEQEGADIPGDNIWKNTIMNSSFYTFDSERYLTTSDYWKVRDLSALAPCDQVYILVNTAKYGGGGIYNHYNLTSCDNELSVKVFVHEFGHGFAGLGDEYYTSDVSYSDFYPTHIEPWEPNLTTLSDFDSKWKNMLESGLPVPTPVEPQYIGKTGVFEGGGYVATGVYRPAFNCRMKSNETEDFCQVCQKAIERAILFQVR